jgi:hypothetical protein
LPLTAIFPWISCDDETGVISVIFYDDSDRDTENEALGTIDTHVAMSKDYGNTWDESRVSDNKFMPHDQVQYFFGDYIGICSEDGITYPAFTDTYDYDFNNCSSKVYVSPFYTWNCVPNYFNVIEPVNNSNPIEEWEVYKYDPNGTNGNITAENKIENNGVAVFNAGTEIVFQPTGDTHDTDNPGFWSKNGSFTHAYIDGCLCFPPTSPPPSDDSKINRVEKNILTTQDIQKYSEPNVTIIPNPNNGKFQIEVLNLDIRDCTLEITNSIGMPVYSSNSLDKNPMNIDISNLPKGVYMIKVYNHDKSYMNKIVCK